MDKIDDRPVRERTIFTLGTSTRSMEDFFRILKEREIALVCDVRSFPISSRYPHFSQGFLAASLSREDIAYRWLGKRLGGYRKDGYPAYMKTGDFLEGLGELEELAAVTSTVVVCAELLPWRCHRFHIAGKLQDRGWRVVHIIDTTRDWIPGPREEGLTLF
ncbi:MAG: DUF488 domain-containing protein [Actinomycetota bacterium]|nr:DUF488 domain-containing protein [Actinomycetota bacterium]